MKKLLPLFLVMLFLPFAFATEVTYDTPDTEILGDARVLQEPAWDDTNFGSATTLGHREETNTNGRRTYIMWTNTVPSGATIENALVTWDSTIFESGVGAPEIYEVMATDWSEDTITWNNQPCGTNFDQSSACNLTSESSSTTGAGNKTFDVRSLVQKAVREGRGNISVVVRSSGDANVESIVRSKEGTSGLQLPSLWINYSESETSPPKIVTYNLTSEGGLGCTNWNTDTTNACTTTDTTPTVKITTDIVSNCRIGITDSNYTSLGASRECSGGLSTSHTCTLILDDELNVEESNIYIGCKDSIGDENISSSSGALAVSIQSSDLETLGRNAIETGILASLDSDYVIYTDQKIYIRDANNNQAVGLFDKVVKFASKIWAFNVLTGNETPVGAFNISSVFYAIEFENTGTYDINQSVYQIIEDTK